jgi:hypothetical protein
MPFDAMQRIMKANLIDDLGEEVEKRGSYLQKVAFRIGRTNAPDELGDALQAAMFVAEKDPNRGQMLLDLLDQYAQQSIQTALNKIVTESEDPTTMERDRIQRMADLLRARIMLGREQLELTRIQKEVAQEMGLTGMNPAMAATGQMPLPIAGGAPPMPMPAPQPMPMPMPMQGPAPMPAPPQGAGPQGGGPPGPNLPGSPMEAASL